MKTKQTKQLLSPKQLIRNTWAVYKKHFKKFLIISLLFFGLTWLILIFIGPKSLEIQTQAFPGFSLFQTTNPFLSIGSSQYSLLLLAVFLITILGQAALITALKKIPGNWQVKEAIEGGSKILWPFLWVSILTSLIILIGFVLLIIPGIIFAVWYAFTLYVLVFEEKRGLAALRGSKELVKDYWWPILGRLLILALLALFASMILSLIPYAGVFIFNVLYTPFSVIYITLIYKNLKKLKTTKQ